MHLRYVNWGSKECQHSDGNRPTSEPESSPAPRSADSGGGAAAVAGQLASPVDTSAGELEQPTELGEDAALTGIVNDHSAQECQKQGHGR